MKAHFYFQFFAASFLLFTSLSARAQWFLNTVLLGGDQSLLSAPVADFATELAQLRPIHEPPPTIGNERQSTRQADESDFAEAIGDTEEALELIKKYHLVREQIEKYGDAKEAANNEESTNLPPHLQVSAPEEIPTEFKLYLTGALVFHAGDTNAARAAWEKVLELPKAKRRFKSTWAAFMLGMTWLSENSARAVAYFQQTRSLAATGFRDTLGLSDVSRGWEAKAWMTERDYAKAAALYLQQEDQQSGASSLIMLSRQLFKEETPVLEEAARNRPLRMIVTSYLISPNGHHTHEDANASRNAKDATRWLSVLEKLGAVDVDTSTRAALAAYQSGNLELTDRWLKRSPRAPLSQWIRAKVLLKQGKVEDAGRQLARVVLLFPIGEADAEDGVYRLENNLAMPESRSEGRRPPAQIAAEHAAYCMQRKEFQEGLDALLHANYLADAAYVGERILTADELKAFVDQRWQPSEEAKPPFDEARQMIRSLLARRLTRLNRGFEAKPYFTADALRKFETLDRQLAIAYDEMRPAEERGKAFWAAARIARRDGADLLATEVDPDWQMFGGSYDRDPFAASRVELAKTEKVHATTTELRRARESAPDPNTRFHYRFIAVDLAWQGSMLMPDNSEETAALLCESGSWIKYLDAEAADPFYKALVKRNRKTELGRMADEKRWFPFLPDETEISNP